MTGVGRIWKRSFIPTFWCATSRSFWSHLIRLSSSDHDSEPFPSTYKMSLTCALLFFNTGTIFTGGLESLPPAMTSLSQVISETHWSMMVGRLNSMSPNYSSIFLSTHPICQWLVLPCSFGITSWRWTRRLTYSGKPEHVHHLNSFSCYIGISLWHPSSFSHYVSPSRPFALT